MKPFIEETSFGKLPEKTKLWIEPHLSSNEKILFCVLAAHPERPTVVIITDNHLIYTTGDGLEDGTPSWGDKYEGFGRIKYVLFKQDLENIYNSAVMKVGPFFGEQWSVVMGVDVRQWYECLRFRFDDKEFCEKFDRMLTKAKSEAVVRRKTPAPTNVAVPDIGDQLMKLAELLEKGHLTQAEFEAAKKKLLS